MTKKLKSLIKKILIFILVWLASLLVIGIVGASLELGDKIGVLFSLVVLFAPIALATLAVIPKKKLHPKNDALPTKETDTNASADTKPTPTTPPECNFTDDQEKLVDEIIRAFHEETAPNATASVEGSVRSEPKTACAEAGPGKVYHVTGIQHYEANILNLAVDNSDYDMSKRELVDNDMIEERIWKYNFNPVKVSLVPEPENPYDPNAIKVIVDDEHIGYIKKGSCKHLLKAMAEGRLGDIDCTIGGGPYKYIYEDCDENGNEKYEMDRDEVGYSVVLNIVEHEA